MAKAATLEVEIGARFDKFLAGFAQVEAKMKKFGKNMEDVGKKLMLRVTLPLAAVGGASIKMAMDAVESENLFEQSMKGMAGAARAWSKELSKSLGLNQFETRKTIGTFNVMMKSMGGSKKAAFDMAKGLTQLGYDMASFYNLRADEAFLKLQSAISGEVEPLKRLGIIVNETTIKTWALNNGLIKQGETMTEAQKVTARYNVIMQQTKDAQGDLERTLDSPTNKIRILQSRIKELAIEMGMKLLPVFERILAHVEKGVTWFSGLSDSTKEFIIKAAVLAAAIGPLSFTFGKIAQILPALKIGLTALLSPAGLVAVAFVGIALSIKNMVDTLKDAKKEMSDFADEAAIFSNAADNFQKLWIAVGEKGGKTLEQFNELFKRFGGNWDSIMKTIVRDPKFATLKALLLDIASGVKTVSLETKDLSIQMPQSLMEVDTATKKSGNFWIWWAEVVKKAAEDSYVKLLKFRALGAKGLDLGPAVAMPQFVLGTEAFEDWDEWYGSWLAQLEEKWHKSWEGTLYWASYFTGELSNIFGQLGANRMAQIDAEYERQREAIENSLASEENKAVALERLDKKTEKERKKAMRSQAIAEKATNFMAAVVNTARAITEVLPNIPLSIIIGALGAVQIATIAAAKLPSLKEGGWLPQPMPVMAGHGPSGEIVASPALLARLITKEIPRQEGTAGGGVNLTIAPVINIAAMDSLGVRDFMRTRGMTEIVDAINAGIQKPEFKKALGVG